MLSLDIRKRHPSCQEHIISDTFVSEQRLSEREVRLRGCDSTRSNIVEVERILTIHPSLIHLDHFSNQNENYRKNQCPTKIDVLTLTPNSKSFFDFHFASDLNRYASTGVEMKSEYETIASVMFDSEQM